MPTDKEQNSKSSTAGDMVPTRLLERNLADDEEVRQLAYQSGRSVGVQPILRKKIGFGRSGRLVITGVRAPSRTSKIGRALLRPMQARIAKRPVLECRIR